MDETTADLLARLRTALAARGVLLAPGGEAAPAAAAARLGFRLPDALAGLLAEVSDGTAGTGGSQAFLAAEEIAPRAEAVGARGLLLDPEGAAEELAPDDAVAITEEDVDGGCWCLVAPARGDARVGYHAPFAPSPGLHAVLGSVADLLRAVADAEGAEAVLALDLVGPLGLSPR